MQIADSQPATQPGSALEVISLIPAQQDVTQLLARTLTRAAKQEGLVVCIDIVQRYSLRLFGTSIEQSMTSVTLLQVKHTV